MISVAGMLPSDLPAGASGLRSLAGPGAAPMRHPGRAARWPRAPSPSPTLVLVTPRDILGSRAIMHMLLAEDKAFLCHYLGPGFRGGRDPGQSAVLSASPPHLQTCHSHTRGEHKSCQREAAFSLQFPSAEPLGTRRWWALQGGGPKDPSYGGTVLQRDWCGNQAAPAPLWKTRVGEGGAYTGHLRGRGAPQKDVPSGA